MPLPLAVAGALAAAKRIITAIPREFWYALAIIAALLWLRGWHNDKVADALRDGRDAGRTEQAAADTEAFRQAQDLATERQDTLRQSVNKTAAAISERTTDVLQKRTDDLARRYDDLRLRWAAARQADPGRPGEGAATGLPGGTASPDDAYCAAQGWVSFDTAAAAAEAADTAIAKDDQWRAWYLAQREAWPR